MKLIVVILSAFVALTTARNATFYTVDEAIEDQYIIVMQAGYNTASIQKVILQDKSGIFKGASIKYTYTKAISGFSAKLSKMAVEKLLAREDVKYITQDGVVRVSAVASWGLDRTDQRDLPLDGQADFLGDGTGVNVYVIDTGIYPDSLYFGGRATAAFDSDPIEGAYGIDCQGHGTHCAGTVGADIYGMAPGVNLFGVRVLGCDGSGSNSGVIAGCDYVAKSGVQPAVASMSLGGGSSQAIDDAVQGMIDAGITTVVAAGNSDSNACYYSPARGDNVITVGATQIDDTRSSFSNYGSCVDVFAPGTDIPSAGIRGPEDTRTLSGTSMACPHVTGAVAICLANKPYLTPAELKAKVIEKSTLDLIKDVGNGSPNRLLYVP